jgi:hypothetical protein
MKRVLFTMLLCALGPAQVSAQNDTSQQLLELDEEQRNAAFAHMLWDSERKCDQVIRTLFNGTVLGVDNWGVLCRDRRSSARRWRGRLRSCAANRWRSMSRLLRHAPLAWTRWRRRRAVQDGSFDLCPL